MHRIITIVIIVTVLMIATSPLSASIPWGAPGVTQTESFSTWQAMTGGPHTTIDFTTLDPWTVVTTQYQDLGATFTNPWNIVQQTWSDYPQDGFGLKNLTDAYIEVEFSEPQYWVGAHYNASMRFWLYSEGTLFYVSLGTGGPPGSFVGFFSEHAFDKVIFAAASDSFVNIDNIYFGHPVPAPGALGLLMIGATLKRRRR